MSAFLFTYYTTKNGLTADEFVIRAQMGPLIKKEFAPQDLLNYYHFKTAQYQALFATYRDANGKTKKIHLYSNFNEPGFTEMMEYLSKKFPKESLNHLPENEALRSMRVANPNKWVPPFVFVLLSLCMTVFFYPMLRHYFDSGHREISVENFANVPAFSTRNVTITGYPLDVGVKETTTSSRGGSWSSTNIPMVPENWKEGDPIHVVLEFSSGGYGVLERAAQKTTFTGVIRDIWWEGVSSDNIDFLTEKYQLRFEDPVLIEVTNGNKPDDFVPWVWGGSIVFILVLVIFVAVKMKRSGN